jgi:hypothetical protein
LRQNRLLNKEKIMRQLILGAIASMSLLGSLATNPAGAQVLRPIGTGGISPYLNLTRTNINPAINYYGTVRPQLAYSTAINSLEQQVQASRVAATAQESLNVPTTGHQVGFLNYQRYFLNLSGGFQNLQASAGAGAAGVTAGAGSAGSRALSNISSGTSTPSTGSSRR